MTVLFFAPNPVLIAAAVIPAIVLLVYVYRADKLDREPPMLLLSLIMRGVFATALAVYTERIGVQLLDLYCKDNDILYRVLLYFVVVACSEEGFKYMLLRMRTWKSLAFNCQFDGVVYAVFVSLGFALWENIDYVIMYGFGTALLRAVTAVPGHACFGVFMGAFYGFAKRCESCGRKAESRLFGFLSLAAPVVLHGFYDFAASIDDDRYAWVFTVFIAAMFLVTFLLVRRLSKNDKYIGNNYNY